MCLTLGQGLLKLAKKRLDGLLKLTLRAAQVEIAKIILAITLCQDVASSVAAPQATVKCILKSRCCSLQSCLNFVPKLDTNQLNGDLFM